MYKMHSSYLKNSSIHSRIIPVVLKYYHIYPRPFLFKINKIRRLKKKMESRSRPPQMTFELHATGHRKNEIHPEKGLNWQWPLSKICISVAGTFKRNDGIRFFFVVVVLTVSLKRDHRRNLVVSCWKIQKDINKITV